MYTTWEIWLNGELYDVVRWQRHFSMFLVKESMVNIFGYPENIILIFAK